MRLNGKLLILFLIINVLISVVIFNQSFNETNDQLIFKEDKNYNSSLNKLFEQKATDVDQEYNFNENEFNQKKTFTYTLGGFREDQHKIPEKKFRTDNEISNNHLRHNGEDNLPNSWDWRNVNGFDWTTSIKNQRSCGSCWAFAALGALESMINIEENNSILDLDLSEQYLLSCLSEAGSCNGGWVSKAFEMIKSESKEGNYNNGIITEQCMPYESDDTIPCSLKCSDWMNHLFPIVDYGIVYNPSIEEVKNMIIKNGPVAAYMDVYYDFYLYDHGIYSHTDGSYQGGHAIVIVGYNDSLNCWICKNSWGEQWGENGWFRIAYNDSNVASLTYWVTYKNSSKPVADAGGPYTANPNEIIKFDGSNSYSPQGNIVHYRWDFNTDGIWDTNWLNTSHAMFSYSMEGNYTVTLQILDSNNMMDTDTSSALIQHYPVAITNGPYVAEPYETIYLDGSNSKSADYTIDTYHWEAEQPSFIIDENKSDPYAELFFYNTGDYWIKLTVKNNTGVSHSVYTKATISHAPTISKHPTPRHRSTGIDVDQKLRWYPSKDIDQYDTVTYDVYFCQKRGSVKETINILNSKESLVLVDSPTAMFNPGSLFESNTLNYGTTYFWRVIAKENHGLEHQGPFWNFTTAPMAPPIEITDVTGGTNGIHVSIHNNGDSHQTDVDYTFQIHPDEETTLYEPKQLVKHNVVSSIPVHQTVTIHTDKFIGYGYFDIILTIEGIEENQMYECFVVYDHVSIVK